MSLEHLTNKASFAKETAACLKAVPAFLVSTGVKVRGSAGPGFWLRNSPPSSTMTQEYAGSFLLHKHKVRRTTQAGLKAVKHQQKLAPGIVQSCSWLLVFFPTSLASILKPTPIECLATCQKNASGRGLALLALLLFCSSPINGPASGIRYPRALYCKNSLLRQSACKAPQARMTAARDMHDPFLQE